MIIYTESLILKAMRKKYKHYITNNIKSLYRSRIAPSLIFLVILILLWFITPISDMVLTESVDTSESLTDLYKDNVSYIDIKLSDLYFTGHTQSSFGMTTGYYYYTMKGEECILVLLSPSSCQQGLPHIESLNVKAQISRADRVTTEFMEQFAETIGWTQEGMSAALGNIYLNQPAHNSFFSHLLRLAYFGAFLYALITSILAYVYYRFPVLSPPVQQLARFGKPAELLAEAEEELATLPQLATDDMFITEHYFIEISKYGIAIVPIDEIIWVYKHSTLHKLFWYHFSISYTLHITARKHFYIHCPKNIKSDIDGIIDYLAEANHSILVGFTEQNRLIIQEAEGIPKPLKNAIDLFKHNYRQFIKGKRKRRK